MSTDGYHWYSALQQAIRRNRRDAHNRYLQLATVRSDGTPAVRTLVFRELCEAPAQLRMVTDRRSDKTTEVASNPPGEIAWYFSHSREQFRLRGTLELVGAEDTGQDARLALWEKLSVKAREQFYWPQPGAPLDDAATPAEDTAQAMPPESFAMLSLSIRRIDHLCLRGDPQTRVISEPAEDGSWRSRPVNP